MKYFTLLLLSVLFSFLSQAQPADSLEVSEMLARVKTQLNLDAEKSTTTLDSIQRLVSHRQHNPFQKAEYEKVRAMYLYRKSLYDSAIVHYQNALSIYAFIPSELDMAKIYINMSMAHNRLGDFEKTFEQASHALTLFEELGDAKGIGISLNIIGQVFFFNEDYQKAKIYFAKYLAHAQDAGDSLEMASGWNNLGSAHTKLHAFDSAVAAYKKALYIHSSLNSGYGEANAYQNIASNFLESGRTDSAIVNYDRAITRYQMLGNNSGLAESHVNLGQLHLGKNAIAQAIVHLTKGIQIAREIKEPFLIQQASKALSDAYATKGDFQQALQFYRDFHQTSDSIFNENTRKNIAEINTKYETEKKEQQIALQSAEISEQNARNQRNYLIITSLIIVILLLLVISILIRSRARKKQALLQQEVEITLRQSQLEAALNSQETERKRFARDLHDGFGQMISVLNLNLKSLEKGDSTREEVFEKSSHILEEMYKELKGICFNLMPETLIKQGVVAALQEFSSRINNTGQLHIYIDAFGINERLTDLQEISIYRITQEWVNNILKYANATRITVSLTRDEEEITLLIEDNGAGFDSNLLRQSSGNGWKNIQSRANLLKGDLELDTTPGTQRSTLIINIPIRVIPEQKPF